MPQASVMITTVLLSPTRPTPIHLLLAFTTMYTVGLKLEALVPLSRGQLPM